jgi:tartrate dehydratase alpha subunit/fumarate hydratase class I-like protein
MKNYSINEDYQKINLMIKKEIVNKIKEKTKKEKTTIKKIIEEILTKNL